MRKLLLTLFVTFLSFVSRATGENDDLWLYWTVDATESGIEFLGAKLYVVEEEGGTGRLISTKWSEGVVTGTTTMTLTGENELKLPSPTTPSLPCGQCLISDIKGIGIGAAFYVELVGANNVTVGYWTGEYMTMEALTTAHEALTGLVSGLQTERVYQHVHGGEWVADQFSTVPEPSGGLLTLVGLALLALRRRKVCGGRRGE